MTPVWLQRGQAGFAAVEAFISGRIWGTPRIMPGETILAALTRDGALSGAVIYQNYDEGAGVVELSAGAVTPKWLSRRVLYEMFSYPFDQLGCQACVMRCDPSDKRISRIFGAYGFDRYDIPRLRGRFKGEAIYILTEETWRANGFHKENANG